jgi:hypothetical protein
MVKIHTRFKRRKGSATGLRNVRPETRVRKARPKSFTSEDNANKWAEAQGIKEYTLKNLRVGEKDKKIQVIPN